MFTGIITDIGSVLSLTQNGDLHAKIKCGYDMQKVDIGASIACDGVCLTVTSKGVSDFDVDISAETVSLTNVSNWRVGKRVNLERALKVGDELGGHIVSGHVDGVAEMTDLYAEGDSIRMAFVAPEKLAKFLAPKGSVALNGTSLTINQAEGCNFDVNIIPHTQQMTTWGDSAKGDLANLEIDTIARYVARLAERR